MPPVATPSPAPLPLPPLEELGPLTDDRLTRDMSLLQRKKGHRFSSDDIATAYVAALAQPQARAILDLGCGIGSVLLHLAWSFPQARLAGIEAQAMSFALLCHNVARNGVADRVAIFHGDLRDALAMAPLGGPYDLITGTPPYFPPNAALDAMDEQRAYARIEYRGGVEAYIAAATSRLAPHGALVLCGDARAQARVEAAAHHQGLLLVATTAVVAHAPKPPLFAIWTLRPGAGAQRGEDVSAPLAGEARLPTVLTLRDERAQTTDDARRLKAFSGL